VENKISNNKEIDKYLSVLKNVKQIKGNVWKASCPNGFAHEHNDDPKLGGKTSFTIAVQHTKEKNKHKFGDTIVTYKCWTNGGTKDNPGPCSQKKLTEVFKKLNPQIKGTTRWNKSPPDVFPLGDDSYLEFKDIGTKNEGLYFYHSPLGQKMFLKWKCRQQDDKDYLPVCYSHHVAGGWVNQQLWEVRPLFRLHDLWKTKLSKCLIVEGEATALKAQELFLDYFVTTCDGGASGWTKTDLQMLKTKSNFEGENKFDEVILWNDNDVVGKRNFKALGVYLLKRGINTKIVKLPTTLPKKWDLNNVIPDDVDIHQILSSAVVPAEREDNDYSDLEGDTLKKRWSHITNSRKYYYDHFKKEITHRENLNLWYENDTETRLGRLNPERYLHKEACDRIEGLAYLPTDKRVIWEDNHKYINTYVPFQHKALTEEEIKQIDLSVIFRHLDIICNNDKSVSKNFLDIIAHGIQNPYANLKYATLIVGDRGVGKTQIWKILQDLYGGKKYCIFLKTRDLVGKFRKWMSHKNILFCNEIEITGYDKEGQIHILKELIDDENHSIESKGVDTYQIKNHFRLFASSNQMQQLLIENDKKNRGWFVMECLMSRDDIIKKYPNHLRELDEFRLNEHKIAELAHYCKYQHKLSKDFSWEHPMETSAKESMARSTRAQLFLDLDEELANRKGCFARDLVNTRILYDELKWLDKELKTNDWKDLTENKIIQWLKSHKAKKIKNGEAVSIDGGKKRHWWAIRNIDEWSKEEDLKILRLHMKGKEEVEPTISKEEADLLDLTTIKREINVHSENRGVS
jgi:hypothetical protein|tara:strand:- start:20 stop:2419 length:2400 start_codon:yes stop_codon:yes gene_type:complete